MINKKLQTINELQIKIEMLRREIIQTILLLPDNPNVMRISKHAFMISSNNHGTNWTPFYHDFKQQYQVITDILSRVSADYIEAVLDRIINKHVYYDGKTRYEFHPEVIANLLTIYESEIGE